MIRRHIPLKRSKHKEGPGEIKPRPFVNLSKTYSMNSNSECLRRIKQLEQGVKLDG